MKKTVTVSISIPVELSNKLDKLGEELAVNRSALCTAIISLVLKWNLLEGIKNGICRR